MRDVFFGALVLLALVMLLIDLWPSIVGTSTCASTHADRHSVKCDGGEGQTEEDLSACDAQVDDLEAWLDSVWEKVSKK